MSLLNILNIWWNIIIVTILISLLISGLFLLWLFSHYLALCLLMFYWMTDVHFTLLSVGFFFYFHKYSWVSFLNAVKLFRNSLILSCPDLSFVSLTRTVFSLGLVYTNESRPRCILYSIFLKLRSFQIRLVGVNIVPDPSWMSGTTSPNPFGSFFSILD